jgi:hypothetical protein
MVVSLTRQILQARVLNLTKTQPNGRGRWFAES